MSAAAGKLRYGALPDPLQQPYTASERDEKDKKDVISWKDAIRHLEIAPETRRESLVQTSWAEIKVDAERSEEHEHSLTLWESLRLYKASVLWAGAASLCIVMEGYDTALLGSFWALPAFRLHFGEYLPDRGIYQVPAAWQAAIGQAPVIGNFFGIFWGAYCVERYGYRKTLMLNMFLMMPFIGMVTFAPNKAVLLVGELLCGVPWGVFSTLAEAYSSEIAPLTLRAYLTTYVNLCWVIGQFIAACVILAIQNIQGEWSFRLPFAIQWVWPVPLFILIYFMPESPWWLTRHGYVERAEQSIRRLAAPEMRDRARDTVAMMIRTNQLELDVSEGTGYLDCFRGADLRRTEISLMAWGGQQFSGLPFAGQAPYFFFVAGLSEANAYRLALGNAGGAILGTLFSWILITKFGRRGIYLMGMIILTCGQLLIGVLAVVADRGNSGARWAQAGVMLGWIFTYDATVGPVAYAIVGEVSSTRLRNKTIGMSRNFYNILSVIAGVFVPYALNPGQWNWGGKVGFFWAPIALGMTIWTYYRLPEFKDRSYFELDMLFERQVSARNFSRTVVEADADEVHREENGLATH